MTTRIKRQAAELLEIAFENKEAFDDQTYLALCNGLKKIYAAAGSAQGTAYPGFFDAATTGGYFIASPDLLPQFGYSHDELCEAICAHGDFDLCIRYDGKFDFLPDGEYLAPIAFTAHGRSQGWDAEDPLDLTGPFFKFTSPLNIEFAWAAAAGWQAAVNAMHSPSSLWLRPWMLHQLQPVGDGCCYDRVVTFPNSYGFGHAMWAPTLCGHDDYSLFERFCANDTGNAFVRKVISELENDHPMKWIGSRRGMQHGALWKTLRGKWAVKRIVEYWKEQVRVDGAAPKRQRQ